MKARLIHSCLRLPLVLFAATWAATSAAMDPPDSGGGGSSGSSPTDGGSSSSGGPNSTSLACGDKVASDDFPNVKPLFWSVVKATDATHKGHLHAPGEPGTMYPFPQCGVANPVPNVVEPERDFHFKMHTFTNFTGADACVVAELIFSACGVHEPCPPEKVNCTDPDPLKCDTGVGLHEVGVYLNAFDSTDIRKNFIADSTRFDGGPGIEHIEFSVPKGANFVLVVSAPDFDEVGYDPYYDVYVKGCGQPSASPGTSTTGTTSSSSSGASSSSSSGSQPNEQTGESSSSGAAPVSGGASGSDNGGARPASVMRNTEPARAEGGGCNASPTTNSSLSLSGFLTVVSVLAARRRRR